MTRIFGRTGLPVAILILLAAVGSAWAADLRVAVVSLSSPVAPSGDATLEVQTTPGAACRIAVHYKSGPSRARGLVPKPADRNGPAPWLWPLPSPPPPP